MIRTSFAARGRASALSAVLALAATAALALLPAATASAVPSPSPAPVAATAVSDSDRVVVYYQKQFADGSGAYISPLPLVAQNTGVDVVNLAAVHMNADALKLNDLLPDDPQFAQMWTDLAAVQASGVPVIGMIGGAVNDTWVNLEADYATQYPRLHDFVVEHHLDGIDLDVETPTDVAVVEQVIADLNRDFGDGFLITLSPVTAALTGEDNLSGFDYNELYAASGAQIDWFNTQFYCGWGDPTAENYRDIVNYQATEGAGIPASKIVMAVLTNPANCDNGWVPLDQLTQTIGELRATVPGFGGVAGWEYFNSLPGGPDAPWQWAAVMRAAMDAPLPTPTPTPSPTAAPAPAPAPTTASPEPTLAATGATTEFSALSAAALLVAGLSILALGRRRGRSGA